MMDRIWILHQNDQKALSQQKDTGKKFRKTVAIKNLDEHQA